MNDPELIESNRGPADLLASDKKPEAVFFKQMTPDRAVQGNESADKQDAQGENPGGITLSQKAGTEQAAQGQSKPSEESKDKQLLETPVKQG